MGTTKERLASQALGLLREESISSFDDGTNAADIVKLYYDDFVEDMLTRYPWSFVKLKRKLNQDSAAPLNEYKYSHIVPAEALRMFAVYPSGKVGAKGLTDFDIQAPDGARRIFSNHSELWGEYTVYADESNWPAYFSGFAQYAFAAHIALPVTDDEGLAQLMHTKAFGTSEEKEKGGKFSVAVGIDDLQKPGEEIISSPLIEARFS